MTTSRTPSSTSGPPRGASEGTGGLLTSEKTSEKACRDLGLTSLAQALPVLLDAARQQQLPYEAFLVQALGAELEGRAARARERRRRAAHLLDHKTLDTFDFTFQPSLSEPLVRELAGLSFVQSATNVVFLGPPGVGETHLATALAVQALEAGHAVVFTTLAHLAEGMDSGASQFQTWRTRLRRYLQPPVLVIDEIGYTRLTPAQAHALFELVNARYEKGAILLTSNTSFAEWGSLLGNDVLASALLDRLLHHAEVIAITGPSYRMKERQLAVQAMASA